MISVSISISVVTLLSILCRDVVSQEQTLGAAQQDCTSYETDVLCTSDSATLDIVQSNELNCGDFECCQCASLTCNDCTKVSINGHKGAFGVPSLTVNGKLNLGGAVIETDGVLALSGATVTGDNIRDIDFDGGGAFTGSTGTFTCIAPVGCELSCSQNACVESTINVENIAELSCHEDKSCEKSTFALKPVNRFVFNCKGKNGCKSIDATLTISECINTPTIEKIDCGAINDGCTDATIRIVNTDPDQNCQVDIHTIDCVGTNACKNTKFILEGNVYVGDFKCSNDGCVGTTVNGGTSFNTV